MRSPHYAVPAAALLFTGGRRLLAHAHGMALSLALLEIAFGALLVHSLLQPSARTGDIRRIEMLAASVLGIDVLERWYGGDFAWSTALMAVGTLLLALASAKLFETRESRTAVEPSRRST